MTNEQSVWRFARVFGMTVLVLSVAVIVRPVSTYAGDDDDTTVEFLSIQEAFSYGPPLPANIEIQLAVSSNITETKTVDITLHVMNLVSPVGRSVSLDELIVDYPEGGYREVLPTPSTMVVPFTINLNEYPTVEWGTYTGLLVAQLADQKPVAKSISLVVGPQESSVILSPEIVVTATGCPNFLNDIESEAWKRSLAFLCPRHLITETRTVEGSGEEEKVSRFQVQIEGRGAFIRLEGFDDRYWETSGGVAVSKEGAGRIWLRLDEKAYLKECPERDCRFDNYKIALGGSSNSGKYEGIFYLDTSHTGEDATKVPVTVLVRDQIAFPLIVILGGVLASLGLNWYFGIWLAEERVQKDKTGKEKSLRKAVEQLSCELAEFLNPENAYIKDRFYRTHADVVYEAYALVDNQPSLSDEERLGQLHSLVFLFRRFRDLCGRLYVTYTWYKEVTVTAKTGKDRRACKDKLLEIGEGLTLAKKRLWTADTEQTMGRAQDVLIRTLLKVDELFEQCKASQDLPPVKREPKGSAQTLLVNEQDTPEKGRRKCEWVLKVLSSLMRHMVSNLFWSSIRVLIVLLSGAYVVYLNNPTFGSVKDYVWAFLWGSTTDAAIKAVASLMGKAESPIAALSGLLKG